MKESSNIEKLQKQHFDAIASKYAAHYGDYWSQKYRHKFINESLFDGLNLENAKVLDALCGSGETTGYLLEKGAQVTGLDISPEEMDQFLKRFPGCNAVCTSILSTGLDNNSYDCVVIVGGLHHLHPNIVDAINEIHRILKVGGYFCFMEPHKGSLPDIARQFWYKRDTYFAENEAAIDLDFLEKTFSSKFKYLKEDYKGNLAYLLVLNSLIFRIPLQVKRIYSPTLLRAESMIEKFQGKLLSCFVVGQWVKI